MIMEIVPCTLNQEEEEREKNPDYELSLIGVGDWPSTESYNQNFCDQTWVIGPICPKCKADLQWTNYIVSK